ncbi:hypothetical protein AMTR_s00221p00017130 [Amborella trichopoda]|uniref:Uncharacterized protein n=1 Tax=Amborella trichopoda TaxID=13333 RepID=W1NP72_AMBTC|nr:hypothetical protein AMTR_s00221p00017130 [Amborella trichopoda]
MQANDWANKYHNKTLPEFSLLSKIYEGSTVDETYKFTGGGIRIEPERPNAALSNDPPLEVQVKSSSSLSDGLVSSGTKRRQSQTSIGTHRRLKQPTFNDSMTEAMTKMANTIEMLVRDTTGNSSVVDGPNARREALKIVEGMWRAGEVGDNVLIMAVRIFQDSTKAEMLILGGSKDAKGLLG